MTIAEIQDRLNCLGFGPLVVDGKAGTKTTNEIKKFQAANKLIADGIAGDKTLALLFAAKGPATNNAYVRPKRTPLTTAQIRAKYGAPGDNKNFVTIELPYPMRVAWDLKTSITKMMCHKLVATNFKAAFAEILATYGLAKIQQLGIDLYGGCYNFRQMRGGSDWSRHSWAIALDLDAERNQLKWGKDKAQFAKPEYKDLIDIMYKHGFLNLGVEKNYDFMHFEIAS